MSFLELFDTARTPSGASPPQPALLQPGDNLTIPIHFLCRRGHATLPAELAACDPVTGDFHRVRHPDTHHAAFNQAIEPWLSEQMQGMQSLLGDTCAAPGPCGKPSEQIIRITLPELYSRPNHPQHQAFVFCFSVCGEEACRRWAERDLGFKMRRMNSLWGDPSE
jgi:hypothetical protein